MRRLVDGLLGAALLLNFGMPVRGASKVAMPLPPAVSEDDVRQWVVLWVGREGLEDRRITYRFVHQRELGARHIADVEWWTTPGVANIRFVFPEELQTVFRMDGLTAYFNAQRMVIHELTHILLGGLYDDGSGHGSARLFANPAEDARMEAITDNLARMLLYRSLPDGLSVAEYIENQIDGGPWRPARDARARIMLRLVRAFDAANESDVAELGKR
jgi:hypothetical protein